MKKIFTIALSTMFLAACSSEDVIVGIQEQEMLPVDISASKQCPEVANGGQSRASILYDKLQPTVFSFAWERNTDCLGVYNTDTEVARSQRMTFTQRTDFPMSDPLKLALLAPGGVKSLRGTTNQYAAYFPLGADDNVRYDSIPVTYEGQVQTGTVDMSVYFYVSSTSSEGYNRYIESEKAASSHLSKYDYLRSAPKNVNSDGTITFDMKRVGAIVRFYLKIPEDAPYVFEELQLYNGSLNFTTNATMDITKDITQVLTPTSTSHVMKLQLGDSGFDLSKENGTLINPEYYYPGNNKAYLIAYMMLAPINFAANGAGDSSLYLVAHERDNGTKHFYKALLTGKPNLLPNTLYRWTVTPGVEDPIEFVETTVEDWQQATGFDNGDGTGTEGW